MNNLRGNTWTPDKLYSFRAKSSANKDSRFQTKQKLQSQKLNKNSPGADSAKDFMAALSPDLVNISQINFETNPDDFSMTNPLVNVQPTSRFMDYEDIHENQRGSSSRKDRNNIIRSSKNWAIKEEESVSRNENSMISPEFDFFKSMNENLFTKMVQSDNEKSKLLEFVERLVFDKKETKEKESQALVNLQMKEMELKNLQEECQKEREE